MAACFAAMLAATTVQVCAAVTTRATGSVIGTIVGGVGVAGASASISAPMTYGAGIGAGPVSANANGSMAPGLGASASRSGAAMNAMLGSGMTGSATVRDVGSGSLTLTNAAGLTMTLDVPQNVVSQLGIRRGSVVALTRTARGILLTNVSYLRSLAGRGRVRSVSARGVTFVNSTGTHTLALARTVSSRLGLQAGSTILVQLLGMTQVRVTAVEARATRH